MTSRPRRSPLRPPTRATPEFSVTRPLASNGNTFTIHRRADGTIARTCVQAVPGTASGCVNGKW